METLTTILGRQFLGYLLAADDEAALAAAVSQPTTRQRSSFNEISAALASGVIDENPLARQIALANRFGYIAPEQTTTTANLLRMAVGGSLPEPPVTEDPVLSGMFDLLQAVYPLLLLPDETNSPFGPQISDVAHHHPNKDALEEAIRTDPVFATLFTTHSETSGWFGSTLRNSSGGGVQLWGFAAQRISIAWQSIKLDQIAPTYEQVAERLSEHIALIRNAIEGKPARVSVRVGLTGVLLPADVNVLDLGWARIRKANPLDRSIAERTGIEGKLQTTTADGQTLSIEYAGDLVVKLEMPYVVRLEELSLESGWPEDLTELNQRLADQLDSIRIGLVLALDSAEPVNVATSWQLVEDPLSTALSPGWNDTKRLPNLVPRQLTPEDIEGWATWAKRVQEHRTPSVAVSIRRMLQAIGGRHSPDDVLVDAIIVWENLFGASQETSLRISTSLAWLLGSDAADRAERQKAYKRLYAARSRIVHGSVSKAKPEKLGQNSREAVLISIAALRAVFHARADLLKLKTSEERSIAAMLDKQD